MRRIKQLFKGTEKEGFYTVTETISDQDIITFAKHKFIWNKFELS